MADVAAPELAPEQVPAGESSTFRNPLDSIVERMDAVAPRENRNPLAKILDNPVGTYLNRALYEGKSIDEAKAGLEGGMSKEAEGEYKLHQFRQWAAQRDQPTGERIAGVLPVVGTAVDVAQRSDYIDAVKAYQAGDHSPEVLGKIAWFEEMEGRKKNASTGETVRDAALKVPGMIAEFGLAGKALSPLGLGMGTAATAATRTGQFAQYLGKAAATAAVVPSMTAETASQRALNNFREGKADQTSMWDLKNLAPAQAVSTLNAVILGRLQGTTWASGVPTVPLRAVAKGAAGVVEQAGADTIGSVADTVIGKTFGDDYKLNTKWGGLLREAANGREGTAKELLAQAVTFSLFAGSHDVASYLKPKVPAPKKEADPVAAVKEFINAGGDPAEAVTINQRFAKLLEEDPANAMERARDLWREEKGDFNQRYAQSVGEAFAKRFAKGEVASPVEPTDQQRESMRREVVEGVPLQLSVMNKLKMRQDARDERRAQASRKAILGPLIAGERGQSMGRAAMAVEDAQSVRVRRDAEAGTAESVRGLTPEGRFAAAESDLTPESFGETPASETDRAWRDMGFDPIETWSDADVRSFAREAGLKGLSGKSIPTVRKAIMDAFGEENARLQAAKEPRPNPWDLNAPARPKVSSLLTPPVEAPPEGKTPVPAETPEPQQVTPETPPNVENGPGTPPVAPSAEVPGKGPIVPPERPGDVAPPTPPVPPVVPPRPPVDINRLRNAQSQRPPVPTPTPIVNTLRTGKPPAGKPERRTAPVEERTPVDEVRDQLHQAGLTEKEIHVLVEAARGRSLADIGADAPLILGRGKNKNLAASKQQVGEIKSKVLKSPGVEPLFEQLKQIFAGRGATERGEGRGPKRQLTPEERHDRRVEREQERATNTFARLPKEIQETIHANPDKFIDPATGKWRTGVMRSMERHTVTRADADQPPKKVLRIAVRSMERAIADAKENPGPESLDRLKWVEDNLRSMLKDQGEKSPNHFIKQRFPGLQNVKSTLGQLKELTRRSGEDDFQYENRKRRSAGARTLYDEVKRDGGFTESSLANSGVDLQAMREGPLADLIAKKGKGKAIDTYAEELFNNEGIAADPTIHPPEQLLRMIESHHLLDAGHFAEQLHARNDALRSLREGDKPVEHPGLFEEGGDILAAGFPIPQQYVDAAVRTLVGERPDPNLPQFTPDPDKNPNTPRALPPESVLSDMATRQRGARTGEDYIDALTTRDFSAQLGDGLAKAWELQMRATKGDPFPRDKDGLITLADGSKGAMEDVIKRELLKPGSEPLTPEQRRSINDDFRPAHEKQVEALRREGVKVLYDTNGDERPISDLTNEGYFPRTTEAPNDTVTWLSEMFRRATGRPGSTQGSFKARKYATEADGIAAGVKYMDYWGRQGAMIADTNRMIVDHRLANDPRLGGKSTVLPTYLRLMQTPAFKEALQNVRDFKQALRDAYGQQLAAAPRNQKRAIRIQFRDAMKNAPRAQDVRDNFMQIARQQATGNVDISVGKAFKGKVYPEEVKQWIEQMHGKGPLRILPAAAKVFQEARNAILGGDFSHAGIQLGILAMLRPATWAKSVMKGLQATVNSKAWESFYSAPENVQAMQEASQVGKKFGASAEHISGVGEGKSLIEKVQYKGWGPGPWYQRTARGMTMALDAAWLNLWKATRPADPRKWSDHAELLDNLLGMGRTEGLGASPERKAIEKGLLLAPAYYRSAAKTIETMLRPGMPVESRIQATKALGSLLAGTAMLTLGTLYGMKQRGMISDEEFWERLDLTKGKGWMIPVKIGGTTIEVGMGGVYRSIVGTLAKLGRSFAGAPGAPGASETLMKSYRGHASVPIRFAVDAITGKDFQGQPITPVQAALSNMAPLAVQDVVAGSGNTKQNVGTAMASLVGARAFPGSESHEYEERLRKFAKETTGKTYSELTIPQQSDLVRALERKGEGKPKQNLSADEVRKMKEGAAASAAEREKRINAAATPDTKARLKQVDAKLPAYDTRIAYNGAQVPLTKDQGERFQSLLVEEYDKQTARWDMARLQALPKKSRDEWVKVQLEAAKARAKTRLVAGR